MCLCVCVYPVLKLNSLLSGPIFVLHTRSDLGADGGGNGGCQMTHVSMIGLHDSTEHTQRAVLPSAHTGSILTN